MLCLPRLTQDSFWFGCSAAILWFNIWQAMGGIVNVRLVGNSIIVTGPYCTAQGIIQQFAELRAAMSVLVHRRLLLMSLGPMAALTRIMKSLLLYVIPTLPLWHSILTTD